MTIQGIDTAGWLVDAERVPSPNCNPRPADATISLLVIHNISLPPGEFGGPYIRQLFTNGLDPAAHDYFRGLAGQRVSAHLVIDRRGAITQFVGFAERAWHAGESRFGDRTNCNDFAIGIELEGTDTTAYTGVQYRALAATTRQLMSHYPQITVDRIVGHSDVAPGRKTDPGPAFDWRRFRRLLVATTD